MTKFYLKATKFTPEVILDPDFNSIRFAGKSYPENTFSFYEPILKWVREFFETPREDVVIEFDIVYFNSSSSKLFFDLFDIFEEAAGSGSKVAIRWLYDIENDAAKEAGEDFKDDFEALDFELIEKPN